MPGENNPPPGPDEIKRLKKNLMEAEEKFLRLTGAVSEAVIIREDGKATQVNERFSKIFGWTLEEINTFKEPPFIAKESLNGVLELFSCLNQETCETFGIDRTGRKFEIEITCNKFEQNDKTVQVVSIRDISRRKKNEKDLNLSAQFAKFNPGPVLRCARDGSIKMANRAVTEIYHVVESDDVNLSDIIVGARHIDLEEVINKDAIVNFSETVGNKIFQITIRGLAGLDCAMVYGTDITDQKELENRFDSIITSATEAIIMIDGAGLTTVWNHAAEKIFGYTASEVMGGKISEFIIPERYINRHIEGVRRFQETGVGVNAGKTLELSALRKGGEEFPIEISYGAPINLDGKFHAVAIIRDITERKEMEHKLQQSMAEQKTILDSAGVGIAMVKDYHAVWWNKAFTTVLGYDLGDTNKIRIEDLFLSGAECHKKESESRRKLSAGETVTLEGKVEHTNGKEIWVRRVLKAVDPSDLSKGIITIGEDFTERKVIEEELRNAKIKAESANRAKSQFLSSMSHELRTPLNGILGFADLLKGEFYGKLNEKQSEHTGQIVRSGKHLLALINDLLDTAKIDAGAMDLDLTECSVEDAVISAQSMISRQAEKKGLSLVNSFEPPGMTVKADLRKFRQILINLLSNAVKYSPSDGEIGIRVMKTDGALVRIEVSDEGIGIAEDQLQKVFSEFHQVDRARDEQLGGTGIGLALTRRLVELHGGKIGVTSEPDKGSVFWFTLPLDKSPFSAVDDTAEEKETKTDVRPGNRILVAEDNEVNLSMIIDMLKMKNHEVAVARNGLEAVELAKTFKPEMVLTDIRMPVMDGLTATRRIRAIPGCENIPVIALTANVGSDAESKQIEAGCTAHLPKPVQSGDLFLTLEKYLPANSEGIETR